MQVSAFDDLKPALSGRALAHKLVRLAEDVDRAGCRQSAMSLVELAYAVLDDSRSVPLGCALFALDKSRAQSQGRL